MEKIFQSLKFNKKFLKEETENNTKNINLNFNNFQINAKNINRNLEFSKNYQKY